MEIDRKSYAHAKRNLLKKGVDFSRIYVNLIKDERKNHYVKSVRIRSFSCLRFPAFGLKTGRYSVSLRIQCKCGKIRNRKTPNTDTFYTVNSSQIETSPPVLYINSVRVANHSCSFAEEEDTLFSTQDKEILSILEEELEGTANFSAINNTRLSGYFYSDNIFNLSRRVLTKMEIKILGNGFGYAPIQNKINESKLTQDFEEFCRKMRLKWHFCNKPTPEFSTTSAFNPKSTWKPPKGGPSLKLFLGQVEKDLLEISKAPLGYSNFSKKEWHFIHSLADERNIVIKKVIRFRAWWCGILTITLLKQGKTE